MFINNEAVSTEVALQWRHNEGEGVLNHQPHDCLLNRLFSGEFTGDRLIPRTNGQ